MRDDICSLLKSEPASSPQAVRLTTLIGLAHYGSGEYAVAVPYLKKPTNMIRRIFRSASR